MKFFADSARLGQVVPILRQGLVAGVTSNPTIVHRDGYPSSQRAALFDAFQSAGAEEILMQAVGSTRATMSADAETLLGFGERMVVKVPATETGFGVAAMLANRSAPVLVTAVYNVAQAAFAASLGAKYIAPYFGRMQDQGQDAIAIVSRMSRALEGCGTSVLVASVRSAGQVEQLVDIGIRYITLDIPVLRQIMLHPDSEASAAKFEEDALLPLMPVIV